VLGVAAAECGEELGDILLGRVAEPLYPTERELGEIPTQVAPVRRQRIDGEPSFHGEMVEVGLDRALELA
jgi:hypothetical protein